MRRYMRVYDTTGEALMKEEGRGVAPASFFRGGGWVAVAVAWACHKYPCFLSALFVLLGALRNNVNRSSVASRVCLRFSIPPDFQRCRRIAGASPEGGCARRPPPM